MRAAAAALTARLVKSAVTESPMWPRAPHQGRNWAGMSGNANGGIFHG
jgi:hypothetical protein